MRCGTGIWDVNFEPGFDWNQVLIQNTPQSSNTIFDTIRNKICETEKDLETFRENRVKDPNNVLVEKKCLTEVRHM